jgi:hypothetical protein
MTVFEFEGLGTTDVRDYQVFTSSHKTPPLTLNSILFILI